MKPKTISIFITFTLLLGSFFLFLEDKSGFNILSTLQVSGEDTTTYDPFSEGAANSVDTVIIDSIQVDSANLVLNPPLAPAKIDLSSMDFDYDTVTSGLRMYNPHQFASLKAKLNGLRTDGGKVRILYLGDSQLEGDYLAGTLRKAFQDEYGGTGPGLIAADKYYSTEHQLSVSTSSNWTQSARMKIKKGNKSIVFRNATLGRNSGSAWLRVNRINLLNAKPDYQQLRVFFNNEEPLDVNIYDDTEMVATYHLDASDALNVVSHAFVHTPAKLKIEFKTKGKLELDALSLDSDRGVYVDNIPLRGKAYPLFSTSDSEAMQITMEQLDPDLVILQYGANVIKYLNDKNIKQFKTKTVNEIKLIQKWCPNAELLLVSTSDIAHKSNAGVVSYSRIGDLKACQYEIAMQNNCVFWDLEQFMQKTGGVKAWVNKNPSLARHDYIHFTKFGAHKIGDELSGILLDEFQR